MPCIEFFLFLHPRGMLYQETNVTVSMLCIGLFLFLRTERGKCMNMRNVSMPCIGLFLFLQQVKRI